MPNPTFRMIVVTKTLHLLSGIVLGKDLITLTIVALCEFDKCGLNNGSFDHSISNLHKNGQKGNIVVSVFYSFDVTACVDLAVK